MTNPVIERWGSLSATGIGVETVFGTSVVPSSYLPMSGNSLELDPGLFSPKLQMGRRDLNVFMLNGQNKMSGSVSGPLFPSNGVELVVAAIGADAAAGYGVTGSSPTSSTTLSSGSIVGATTITVASATGYAVGNIVQVDVNTPTGSVTTAECRKITTISTNTLTLDSPLAYAHASAAAVAKVVAPFTHTISQANQLPSLTIEKNLGGYESLQFSGSRVNKLSVASQATNQEATITADVMAKHAAVLATPSAITVVNEDPFVFAEATVNLFGQALIQAESVSIDIENGIKDTYTMNASHDPQFLTPVSLHVSGKSDLVFTSLDDPTWGYFQKMATSAQGAFSLQLAHPGGAGTWTFSLPQINIKTYTDAVPFDDVIKTTVNFEASLSLTDNYTVQATLVNSVYTAY